MYTLLSGRCSCDHRTVTLPFEVNLIAFDNRFKSTCLIRKLSPMRPGGSSVKSLIRQISRPFFWALDAIVSSAASVTSRSENGVRSSETELFSSRATSRILLIRPSRSSPLDWMVCKCSRWTSESPGDSLKTVARPYASQLELHPLGSECSLERQIVDFEVRDCTVTETGFLRPGHLATVLSFRQPLVLVAA